MHNLKARRFVAVFVVFCLLVVAGFAQSTGSTGYSAPTIDYTTQSQSITTGIGTMASNVFPALIGLFVILLGVKLLPKLAKKFLG